MREEERGTKRVPENEARTKRTSSQNDWVIQEKKRSWGKGRETWGLERFRVVGGSAPGGFVSKD